MATRSCSSGTSDVAARSAGATASTWFGRHADQTGSSSSRVAASAGSPTMATSTASDAANDAATSHCANPVG